MMQKLLNIAMLHEITILANLAREKQLKIVFLKGLILANDVYDSPSIRLGHDIDILVSPDDLEDVLILCRDIGYTSEFFDNLHDIVVSHLLTTNHHFEPIRKAVSVLGMHINIILEVHTQVYIQALHQININRDQVTYTALENAIPFAINNTTKVVILNYQDNFLFLILHTIKHIFHDVLHRMCYGYVNSYISFKNLLDLGLFYQKYESHLNYDKLFPRAIEWDIVPELMFAVMLLKEIAPDIFKTVNISQLYLDHNRKNGFFANAIRVLCNRSMSEVIFMSGEELAKILIFETNVNNHTLPSYSNEYRGVGNCKVHLNKLNEKYSETTFSKYIQGRQLDNFDDLNCVCTSKWDNEYLYFLFEVDDDELVLCDGKELLIDCLCDNIELHFYNHSHKFNQPFISMVRIGIYQNELDFNLLIYERNLNWQEWSRNEYVFSLDVFENKYILELGIKWNKIGIAPKAGISLPFNIIINDYDNKPGGCARLSWTDEIPYLADVSSLGEIKLYD